MTHKEIIEEIKRKGAKNGKEFHRQMGDMKNLQESLTKPLQHLTQVTTEVLMPLKKELEIQNTPKRKKDVVYKGKQYGMAQLSDGRIILTFPTIEMSDAFYENKKDTFLGRLLTKLGIK